eukprot:snap_masked-scaffold_73-processed-gene-0.32-mRNA-1 protein AED:1.00 eAED:1.00 QI:0/-1/0/0/-1/1/1/0/599
MSGRRTKRSVIGIGNLFQKSYAEPSSKKLHQVSASDDSPFQVTRRGGRHSMKQLKRSASGNGRRPSNVNLVKSFKRRRSRVKPEEESIEAADLGLSHYVRYEYPQMKKTTLEAMVTPSVNSSAGVNAERDLLVFLEPSYWEVQFWQAFMTLISIYLAFRLPLYLAFPGSFEKSMITTLCCSLINFLDIFVNFVTGFRKENGQLELDLKKAALSYMKTWFIFDLAVALTGFAKFISSPEASLFYNVEGLNLPSFWKWFLAIPAGKIFKQLYLFPNTDSPQSLRYFSGGIKTGLAFAIGLHWCAISFYFATQTPDSTWFVNQQTSENYTMSERYTVYLHGSLMILTGKGSDLSTMTERWFAVIASVVGICVQAYLLGEVTLLLQKLNAKKTKWRSASETLKTSMQNMRLAPQLQTRVKNSYAFWWAVHGSDDGANEWLTKIPKELRTEVLLEVNRDLLSKVPMFRNANESFLIQIIDKLKVELYLPGGYVVIFGDVGEEMFFVVQGQLQALDREETTVYNLLGPGSFFGEIAVLEKNAKRTATVRAFTYAQVSVLHRNDLFKIQEMYPELSELDGLREVAEQRQESTRKIEEFKRKKAKKK